MRWKKKCVRTHFFLWQNQLELSVFAEGWYDSPDNMKTCQKAAFRAVLIKPTAMVSDLHMKTVKIVRNYRAYGTYKCDVKDCLKNWNSAHSWVDETQSCTQHAGTGVLPHIRRNKGGGGGRAGDKKHLTAHCSACERGNSCVWFCSR